MLLFNPVLHPLKACTIMKLTISLIDTQAKTYIDDLIAIGNAHITLTSINNS